ncbi:hypothetical protein V491_06657 [Pseudogymnoascus sp. VKM F-3775]|nr:hypothetical protein V491_06657 [Pseudogymnoascus sp. VKM F-3775]
MAPPKNPQSSQNEGRMALALQDYKNGHFSSMRAAVITYDVPESTFRSRVKGVRPRRDIKPINRKLTTTEESTLIQWILSMDQQGLPLRANSIQQMANLLLQQRSDINALQMPTVGKCWVRNFVQRHDSIRSQYNHVGCFAPLKRSYGQQVEGYMRHGHIDKQDFLTAYSIARTEAITTSNTHSGFAATGIAPYNPNEVLAKLHTQLRTPTPLLADLYKRSQWVPETPHNIAQLELQTKAIKDYIKSRTKSPPSPTDNALNQLDKGCQMAMHSAVLLTNENKQLRAANERQKRKRAQRRSYIATGGVPTVEKGIQLSQSIDIGVVSGVIHQVQEPQMRAPSKCSICSSLEHNARKCPQKGLSS